MALATSCREAAPAALAATSSLDAVPLAVLSHRAEPLFQVVGGLIAGDILIIAERSRGEIHFFSRRGAHLRTVGRLGNGPGEFTHLAWIQRRGSLLLAFDQSERRLSEFTVAGDFVRATTVRPPEGEAIRAVGVLPNGMLLARSQLLIPPPVAPRLVTRRSSLMRYAFTTEASAERIGEFAEGEKYEEPRPRGGRSVAELPFGLQSDIAVTADGIAMVELDSLLRILDASGKVQTVRSLALSSRADPVTAADKAAARRIFTEDAPPRLKWGEVFDRMPIPRTRPQLGWAGPHSVRLLAPTTSGHLWITEFGGINDSHVSWSVLDARGKQLGRVTSVQEATVLDAVEDLVLLLLWDVDGVESVQLRRVTPALGGSLSHSAGGSGKGDR
ncbi:hypothetical protein HKW67_17325 [Gemmatimonas groenlandica]|uniref:6-bladed beta-propeller n=2 Tax=Gemmatimonas groenlandica TaxID=2732249 RepID=A0A6M4IW89_9BACT|nr:hypothetical protein HKW67_17325 [Gemmatimonas groenlandica]